jgi:hypothetical protein
MCSRMAVILYAEEILRISAMDHKVSYGRRLVSGVAVRVTDLVYATWAIKV